MSLKLQSQRLLSEFSTFGIGGPIRFFAEAATFEEMEEALQFAKDHSVPYLVIGKGSNCLFPDQGYEGLVILNKIDFCEWKGNQVYVGAGYSFSLLGIQSARKGFGGLEFASGIPATVGGAIFMNAGANRRETCEAIHSVVYLDETRKEFFRSDLKFAYRYSPFQRMEGAILAATFTLYPNKAARANQLKIVEGRMKTQPLKEKSAGCIFRNPAPHISAGAMIDQCGLKGFKVGGAKISEIHANFIVNAGHATAQDVLDLIAIVQERVAAKAGVHLEPEIQQFV